MQQHQRDMFSRGLINLANLLAGVFIVGLSLTEKNSAAYVPVIGIVAVSRLYVISLVMPRDKKLT